MSTPLQHGLANNPTPQQFSAPWPIQGFAVSNGTDVVLTVTTDHGNAYAVQPGQPVSVGVPGGVGSLTAQYTQQPNVGQSSLTLFPTLIATSTAPPGGAAGVMKGHAEYDYPVGTTGLKLYDVSGASAAILTAESLTPDGSGFAPSTADNSGIQVGGAVAGGTALNFLAHGGGFVWLAGACFAMSWTFGDGGDYPLLDTLGVFIGNVGTGSLLRIIVVTYVGQG